MSSELVTELYRSFYAVDTNLWNPLARITPERVENSFAYSRSSVVPDVTQIKDIVESYCQTNLIKIRTN
jgi:hypothetical protein